MESRLKNNPSSSNINFEVIYITLNGTISDVYDMVVTRLSSGGCKILLA